MHGMTGDASMMRPFAEKVLPEGWTLLVPEARFRHPIRGNTWWRYEDFEADVTRRRTLSRRELMDVDSSLSQLEKLIAEEAPLGPLVVGGFLAESSDEIGIRSFEVTFVFLDELSDLFTKIFRFSI